MRIFCMGMVLWGLMAMAAHGDAGLLPFTSNFITGPHRGQQFCNVCTLGSRPTVLVFVRRMDATSRVLLRRLSSLQQAQKKSDLVTWVVFLAPHASAQATAVESKADAMVGAESAERVMVSVLDDAQGPPGYRLSSNAAATVFMTRGRNIVARADLRGEAWSADGVAHMVDGVPTRLKL